MQPSLNSPKLRRAYVIGQPDRVCELRSRVPRMAMHVYSGMHGVLGVGPLGDHVGDPMHDDRNVPWRVSTRS